MKANTASRSTASQCLANIFPFRRSQLLPTSQIQRHNDKHAVTFLKFRFRVLFRRHSWIKLSKYGGNRQVPFPFTTAPLSHVMFFFFACFCGRTATLVSTAATSWPRVRTTTELRPSGSCSQTNMIQYFKVK